MSESERRRSNLARVAKNYTTEIFRIHEVVRKIPRTVYDFADLLGKHIEGQFYAEELSPVIATKNTVYPIDKILRKRFETVVLNFLSGGAVLLQILIPGFLLKQ
jgi:hypothetical protein